MVYAGEDLGELAVHLVLVIRQFSLGGVQALGDQPQTRSTQSYFCTVRVVLRLFSHSFPVHTL